MSDKLTTRNGETIPIDQMIEALERSPDSGEILQALKDLRRDKVKRTLGESVKAAQFDRTAVFAEFLAYGEKFARTRQTYQDEVMLLFSWLALRSFHGRIRSSGGRFAYGPDRGGRLVQLPSERRLGHTESLERKYVGSSFPLRDREAKPLSGDR